MLKHHRRNKRLGLLAGLVALIALGVLAWWWLPLLLLPLVWAAHEAWFADHLFYAPGEDYAYDFGDTGHLTPLTKMHTLGSSFTPPGFHAGGLPLFVLFAMLGEYVGRRPPAN